VNAWRLATAELSSAKQERRRLKPITISDAEAERYARNLVEHMYDGDIHLRRKFISAIIRRIVLRDEEGEIELASAPALGALHAVSGRPRGPASAAAPEGLFCHSRSLTLRLPLRYLWNSLRRVSMASP
jgi:hypothetical protein